MKQKNLSLLESQSIICSAIVAIAENNAEIQRLNTLRNWVGKYLNFLRIREISIEKKKIKIDRRFIGALLARFLPPIRRNKAKQNKSNNGGELSKVFIKEHTESEPSIESKTRSCSINPIGSRDQLDTISWRYMVTILLCCLSARCSTLSTQ